MGKQPFGRHAEWYSEFSIFQTQQVDKKGEAEYQKPNLEHRQSSVSAVSVIKCQVITETSGNPQTDIQMIV